jgi:hypothetical protein
LGITINVHRQRSSACWLRRCKRADETRRLAEGLRDPEAKRKMLHLASHYDRLAQGSEQQPGTMKD